MNISKKLITVLLISFITSCSKEEINSKYATKNVIIIIMDGARFSETWGEPTHKFIPFESELANLGVTYKKFYNNGETRTVAGHTAVTTGQYQEIANDGSALPTYPSIFQYWLKQNLEDSLKSWIITSKDKLEVLGNCEFEEFNDRYLPSTNCGVNGLGTGYRNDSLTYISFVELLSENNPNLVIVNFKEPDFSAHSYGWNAYINGIQRTDVYIQKIWSFLNVNSNYRDNTTIFITNDHGRHSDGVANGFSSHGDSCGGCQHISLLAIGPDFKKNIVVETNRELIDIASTVAELLQFEMSTSKGKIMDELFK